MKQTWPTFYYFSGHTDCCMMLLNEMQGPLPSNLAQELKSLCGAEMRHVYDLLSGVGK